MKDAKRQFMEDETHGDNKYEKNTVPQYNHDNANNNEILFNPIMDPEVRQCQPLVGKR